MRAFLYNEGNGWQNDQNQPPFIENINEGCLVCENAFTNYDTLGTLIRRYNGIIENHDQSLRVDEELVNLRDALAHGRIASKTPSPDEPQKLVKYDRPQNGQVHVTHCLTMTEEWLKHKVKLVYDNLQRIVKAAEIVEAKHKK